MARLLSATFKGWMTLGLLYCSKCFSQPLAYRPLVSPMVPFTQNKARSISFSIRKLGVVVRLQANSMLVSWETDTNEFCENVFKCSHQTIGINRVSCSQYRSPDASDGQGLAFTAPSLCKCWHTGPLGHARFMLAWSDSQGACRFLLWLISGNGTKAVEFIDKSRSDKIQKVEWLLEVGSPSIRRGK